MRNAFFIFRILGILLIANACGFANAALQWENTLIERTLPIGVERVEVVFAFTNTGKQPVQIIQIQPSCGCTTATLDKQTFEPGEKGSLTAIFDGKGFFGAQEKTIQVVSDDDPKPTTLTLRVTIPELIKVSPRLLWWKVGEEPKAKAALISLHADAEIKITSVTADDPAIKITLQPEQDPKHFRLLAKPTATTTPLQAKVTIVFETEGSASRNYAVYLQVR